MDIQETKDRLTFDELYVSPFTKQRVYDRDGNISYEPVASTKKSTGIGIVEKLLTLIANGTSRRTIMSVMELDYRELNGVMRLLTGMTYNELTRRYALRLADDLLRYTDLGIEEVAKRSHIGSADNMRREFKKAYNCTPNQRRRHLRKRGDLGRYRLMGWIFALLFALPLTAQHYTVSGYVTDLTAEETMIGATLYDHTSGSGTVTNAYGYYSLTLPAGAVELTTSYVGYMPQRTAFALSKDTVVNIALRPHSELDEVTIVGNRLDLGVRGSQMSAVDIPVAQIKAVPAMFGETDVLKVLQLLPGVQSSTEGSAGLYVRGGSPDENLMLIDGVPVYNVNHMFGFFSAFNADAIKNVTLYKGSFPAHYAGRLSSVVDVRMKEGDMHHFHGNLHVGAVSSKFNFEGPLWKGKTSFNISGRRTYSDLMTNAALWYITNIEGDDTNYGAGYYFYDLNVKVNHKFSDRDRLYLSYYSGDDEVYFSFKEQDTKHQTNTAKLGWQWGNVVTAARWNHVITPQMFLDASVSYTQYRHKIGMGFTEVDKMADQTYKAQLDMKSGIYDKSMKTELHYSPTPQHDMRMGASYTHHTFRPDVMTMNEKLDKDENKMKKGEPDILAHETQLYVEDNITLGHAVKMNAGLNYSTFTVGGKFRHALEPRLSSRLLLTDNLSLKAGYAYMTQYVHLLSNSSISLPTDLWVPVTETILPEHAHQVAAGAYYELEGLCDLSVEAYYKHLSNILEYREGSSFMTGNTSWQDKVAMGRGWAYGLELMAQRSIGDFTGWVAYTWAKSMRQFDRTGHIINQGNPFPAKYDRRHDVNITASYKLSPRIDLSATWVYATGNCGTLITHHYEQQPHDPNGYAGQLGYYEGRNNYRMEPYHRMDLSINFHKHFKRHPRVVRTFNISLYNVYNNMNPFMVYLYEGYDWTTDSYYKQLRKVTIFPIIPTISYGVQF